MSRAGAAIIGGLMGLGLAIAIGGALGTAAAIRMSPDPGDAPAGKATRIAAGISEGLNCAAAAGLLTIPLLAFWRARRHQQKA